MSKKTRFGFVAAAAALAGVLMLPSSAEAGRIKKRAENQQDRIAQGIQSGELTAREAGRLEGKETALNQETRDVRKLNGGKLSPGEKKLVNKQQNKLSEQIYDQKRDAQTQPN